MKFLVLLLTAVLLIVSLVSASTTCHDAYSCDGNTILETSTGGVQCYGYHSCYQSSITVTGLGAIWCYGSYSCYEASRLEVNYTSSDLDVYCHGLFSCAFVDRIYTYAGDVMCRAEQSCIHSNIYIYWIFWCY